MPRSGASAAAMLGYDPELLARLDPRFRSALDSASQALMGSMLLLGLSAGVAVWHVGRSPVLVLLSVLGMFLFTANLMRLLIASGGAAPHRQPPRRVQLAGMPVVVIGALSLLMSQPAQLLVDPPQTGQTIEKHRAALTQAHLQLRSSMGLPSSTGFANRLARCDFFVLRLKLLWSTPQRTLIGSAVYVLLVLAPLLLMRTLWLPAVMAYDRLRLRQVIERVARAELATQRHVQHALSAYPTYRPRAPRLGGADRP